MCAAVVLVVVVVVEVDVHLVPSQVWQPECAYQSAVSSLQCPPIWGGGHGMQR